MYEFILIKKKFHSGWVYLALLLLIVAVVISLLECFVKKNLRLRTEESFVLIAIHVQLLVILFLYFVSKRI
jgi:cation transporter-like permease